MADKLDATALGQLFINARTRNAWTKREVTDAQVRELYDLVKLGPTSANTCPARFVWVKSDEGKAKLAEAASSNNKTKILAAPLTVVIGYDLNCTELLPKLFPARGEMLKSMFQSDPALTEATAFRNSSLQGAYLILAARALGLDTGPMSGFDHRLVDEAFFSGTRIKSNFLCSIGYGSDENLFPRNPRLAFEEAGRWA
jgi:3-hydroxypropanoate dehydrogenase